MKPNWKDAPAWAQWLAQDEDGEWYWYENEPQILANMWVASPGRTISCLLASDDWCESLEQRPAVQP